MRINTERLEKVPEDKMAVWMVGVQARIALLKSEIDAAKTTDGSVKLKLYEHQMLVQARNLMSTTALWAKLSLT